MPSRRGYHPSTSPSIRSRIRVFFAHSRALSMKLESDSDFGSAAALVATTVSGARPAVGVVGSVDWAWPVAATRTTAEPSAKARRRYFITGVTLQFPHSVTFEQEPCRDQAQEDAIEYQDSGRRGLGRHPAADKAAERHPAP